MPKPDLNRVPPFYHNYVNLVMQDDLKNAFQNQKNIIDLLKSIPGERWDYSYADGKWTIKELVQHMIDAERIFCYRALCFARKDTVKLPGFEEDDYARNSKANQRFKESLIEELKVVQQSSVTLFNSFDEEQLDASGIANNNSNYVSAIGFIIVGHALHHKKILEERYLQKNPA
ncbi:MAG TPA: DinB family protein [Chitinophagaceae bacterium]|nr:DinB family protein [Chitinophagaceae bacterium]